MTTTSGSRVVLALDTSTDMLACSVAEWTPQDAGSPVRVLATGDHLCRRQTNVELTSTALECLGRAGLTMADVDEVLVGRGPGSFTGVRIGIATGKGLACGLGVPLYGSSTLDAAAWHAWASGVRGMLGVVGDAMRGEVYPGIYELGEQGPHRTFVAETVVKAQVCVDEWAALQDASTLTLTGDGLKKYRARFEEAGFNRFAPEDAWHPSSEGLLRAFAASSRDDAQSSGDPALVLPIYTRLSDAEEAERERLGMGKSGFVKGSGVAEELAGIHTQLRPMSVNDLEQVEALEAKAYVGGVHKPWSARMFEEELAQPGRTWWVAHDRGSIVGFAGGLLAGDTATFRVIRAGKEMDVTVKIEERSDKIAADNTNLWPGFLAVPITDDIRSRYEIDKKVKGIVVGHVIEKTPAAALHLRSGDVITAVNDKKVSSVKEFYDAMNSAGNEIWFDIYSDGHTVSTNRYKLNK